MARLEQMEEVDQKYAKKNKDDFSTKFFVFVDYLFLLIFFFFLCFILLKFFRT